MHCAQGAVSIWYKHVDMQLKGSGMSSFITAGLLQAAHTLRHAVCCLPRLLPQGSAQAEAPHLADQPHSSRGLPPRGTATLLWLVQGLSIMSFFMMRTLSNKHAPPSHPCSFVTTGISVGMRLGCCRAGPWCAACVLHSAGTGPVAGLSTGSPHPPFRGHDSTTTLLPCCRATPSSAA